MDPFGVDEGGRICRKASLCKTLQQPCKSLHYGCLPLSIRRSQVIIPRHRKPYFNHVLGSSPFLRWFPGTPFANHYVDDCFLRVTSVPMDCFRRRVMPKWNFRQNSAKEGGF